MNTLESNDTYAWLASYLPSRVSNTPLYEDVVPDPNVVGASPQTMYPCLVAKLNRDVPLYTNNGYRAWSEEVWLIFVVTYGTSGTQPRQLSDQLATALERLAGIALPGGGQIVTSQRQGQYRRVELEPNGVAAYRERGAFWKIITAKP